MRNGEKMFPGLALLRLQFHTVVSALIGTDYLSSHFRYVDGASYFWAVSLALEGKWSLDR